MVTASVREVQHRLAALLERVERGETVEIRRRHRPVARLVPIIADEAATVPDWSGAEQRLARIYGGRVVGGVPAAELVAEGRGDR